MKRQDRALGLNQPITRRDLIHGAGLSALGSALPPAALARALSGDPASTGQYYPPTRTGLRGAHPGSFEVAHSMVRDGGAAPEPVLLDEHYDAIVVGGGISGLAAAFYYRQTFGAESRILVLDNHDDFGGHAKRNEFHQGGPMRLGFGGTHNMEFGSFSETVNQLMTDLGIDIDAMKPKSQFRYGRDGESGPAIWFDAEHYGEDRLVRGLHIRRAAGPEALAAIDQIPISTPAKERLKAFYSMPATLWPELDEDALWEKLATVPYVDLLRAYGGLKEEEIGLYDNGMYGYWGTSIRAMSAAECLEGGMPGMHLFAAQADDGDEFDDAYDIVMFPDGNASIARLLVQQLVPSVSPGTTADNVALAEFDYSQLDQKDSPVRIRLSATALRVHPAADQNDGSVVYAKGGKAFRARARHVILACNHSIIPYLCPELPKAQLEALHYQVKRPLLLSNVLIRNDAALRKLDLSWAYCPGRLHGFVHQMAGISTGGFDGQADPDGPACLMFWGAVPPPSTDVHLFEQMRAARARMLAMSFADYEREIRTVLQGMLGPAGFDVQRDILAITVNRWPHGYAHDYMDLWDPDWAPGEAPHLIARQRFGNLVFANADAGADAYTHTAIDEAWRAVQELKTQV